MSSVRLPCCLWLRTADARSRLGAGISDGVVTPWRRECWDILEEFWGPGNCSITSFRLPRSLLLCKYVAVSFLRRGLAAVRMSGQDTGVIKDNVQYGAHDTLSGGFHDGRRRENQLPHLYSFLLFFLSYCAVRLVWCCACRCGRYAPPPQETNKMQSSHDLNVRKPAVLTGLVVPTHVVADYMKDWPVEGVVATSLVDMIVRLLLLLLYNPPRSAIG